MIRYLGLIFIFLAIASSAFAFNLRLGIGGGAASSGPPVLSNTLLVSTPDHNAPFDQTVCFTSAAQVGNFFGTGTGDGEPEYTLANGNTYTGGFFTGTPTADAQMCFIRDPMGGGRSRMIGAEVLHGTDSALSALQAITSGTLTFTQNGTVVNVAGINFSADASLTAVAATLQADLLAAIPTFATLSTSSSITGTSCTGIQGYIVAGILNVTAVSSNCIQLGGQITNAYTSWTGNMIMSQISGTAGGVGLYTIWLDNFTENSPVVCSTCTETWNVLTVGTVGSADVVAAGQGIYGTGIPTGIGAGIMANISGAGSGTCTGVECANTTWAVASASPLSISGVAMTTRLPIPLVTYNAYTGATLNTGRFWLDQTAEATYINPYNTISFSTSTGGDPTAQILGWATNSTGVYGFPSDVTQWSGPYLSPTSEILYDTTSSKNASYAARATWYTENFSFGSIQYGVDPDLGYTNGTSVVPTYKNAISTWQSSNPAWNYFRVFSDTAYPEGQTPTYTPPVCTPGVVTLTINGTWNADWCPVHDVYLIGAGGSGGTAVLGAAAVGATGGSGASGAESQLTLWTTDSGNFYNTVAVGVGGNGTTGNGTQVSLAWNITNAAEFIAISGGNGGNASLTGPTAGAAGTTLVAPTEPVLNYGMSNYAYEIAANGKAGQTAADGGAGGAGAASPGVAGHVGGSATASGGAGGAGSSGPGVGSSTATGGNGGTNIDGTAAGAGGTTGTPNGGVPSGGGLGTATVSSGLGAVGHNDTSMSTLPNGGCGNVGPGGGGGGGGAADATTGSPVSSGSGNGGLYGGAGAGGVGNRNVLGMVGAPGAGAGGLFCAIGYQDH